MTVNMSRDDLVWLAGLFEGEAAFDLHKGKYPRIRLGMTDRDVVGRAATLMGANVRLSLKPAPVKAMWHAEVSGAKALDLMLALLPLMGARRSGKIAEVIGHATLDPVTQRNGAPGPVITRPPALR